LSDLFDQKFEGIKYSFANYLCAEFDEETINLHPQETVKRQINQQPNVLPPNFEWPVIFQP